MRLIALLIQSAEGKDLMRLQVGAFLILIHLGSRPRLTR